MDERQTVATNDTGKLLRAAIDIADGCSGLAERRQALLQVLAEMVDADTGHWVWCRARPESDYLLPITFIPYGYTSEQLIALQQFVVDPTIQHDLFRGLEKYRDDNRRDDGVWSLILTEAIPDLHTTPDHFLHAEMSKIGVGDWMQGGRFVYGDSFTVMTLGRRPGKPHFGPTHRELIDLAFTNIPWLWANPDETVSQESIDSLTPRQRAVIFLLLDGLPRKKIAANLGIGEETVDHHLKAVFKHFEVQSAMELAARFLRSK